MQEIIKEKVDYTIGIPFYNDLKNLNTLLASIENQVVNFTFVVIIIDDFSKKPLNLKKDYALNLSISRNPKNLGPGSTRTKILNAANTEYLLFLDSDSFLPEKNSLQRLFDSRELASITYPEIRDDLDAVIHPWAAYEYRPTMMVCVQIKLQELKDKKLRFRSVFDFFCEDMCFLFECVDRNLSFHYCSDILVRHSRATTAQCPIRLTDKKHINLMFGYFSLRFLFGRKIKSTWCDFNYVKNVFKRNFLNGQKDEEYMRMIKAISIFLIRLPKLVWLKYITWNINRVNTL